MNPHKYAQSIMSDESANDLKQKKDHALPYDSDEQDTGINNIGLDIFPAVQEKFELKPFEDLTDTDVESEQTNMSTTKAKTDIVNETDHSTVQAVPASSHYADAETSGQSIATSLLPFQPLSPEEFIRQFGSNKHEIAFGSLSDNSESFQQPDTTVPNPKEIILAQPSTNAVVNARSSMPMSPVEWIRTVRSSNIQSEPGTNTYASATKYIDKTTYIPDNRLNSELLELSVNDADSRANSDRVGFSIMEVALRAIEETKRALNQRSPGLRSPKTTGSRSLKDP